MRYNSRMNARILAFVFVVLSLSNCHAQEAATKPEPVKSQSAVASKTKTFASVAPTDASVSKALKAVNLESFRTLVSKDVVFEGTVVKTFAPKTNSVLVLNFAKDFKTAISAALRPKDYAAFPDLKALEGKRVLISGKLEDYKGRLEVVLTKPEQIKLIREK
jgi:hypothetical protein